MCVVAILTELLGCKQHLDTLTMGKINTSSLIVLQSSRTSQEYCQHLFGFTLLDNLHYKSYIYNTIFFNKWKASKVSENCECNDTVQGLCITWIYVTEVAYNIWQLYLLRLHCFWHTFTCSSLGKMGSWVGWYGKYSQSFPVVDV